VYFERSLGYLELASSPEDVIALRDALADKTYIARS